MTFRGLVSSLLKNLLQIAISLLAIMGGLLAAILWPFYALHVLADRFAVRGGEVATIAVAARIPKEEETQQV